jgi:hypothetical protein
MKNLEEKKLLVKMARMLGEPVDQALLESIEREEKLTSLLFKEEKKQKIKTISHEEKTHLNPVLIFEEPKSEPEMILEVPLLPSQPEEAETNIQPPEDYKVNKVSAYLDSISNTKKPTFATTLQDNEFQALRKTVHDLLQKVNTLSWGSGGTGAVRIIDQDDLVKSTVQNGRYMKYQDGWFVMDEINPYEIVHNATLVTTNTYVVADNDYYIGVNYAGPVIIIIPSEPNSGREIVIKDESGNCSNNPITVSGPVDNDNSGFILEVDNGAVHMLFRGDYWRII